jgi:hypothetical protein
MKTQTPRALSTAARSLIALCGLALPLALSPAAARADTATANASASIVEAGQIGEAGALSLVSTAPSHGAKSLGLTPALFDLARPSDQVFSTQVSSSVMAQNALGGPPVAVALVSSRPSGQLPGAEAGPARGRIAVNGRVSLAQDAAPGLYTSLLYVVVGYN